ncbi:MAG: MSMEG_4193 family putative phosphomutase [Candidatus Dormibacteria bacterium]
MLLLLIRHGMTDLTRTQLVGRTPGVPLNEEGRGQARRLVERLLGVSLDAIFSSPLQRTMETAAPLAAARSLTVVEEPGLVEFDYGDWQGRPYKELQKTDLWKRVQQRPADARFPNGEAVREAQARAIAAVERIFYLHPSGTVAAFSHSDMIKVAIAHLAGTHLDLFQRIAVAPVSVSAVGLGGPVPQLLRLNDTGPLSDLQGARPRPRRKGSDTSRHN